MNREILLKGTSRKIISQEGGLPNFLVSLMKVALPLMKNVLTPLAKSILIPLGLMSSRCSYSKENLCIRHGCTDNIRQRNQRYHDNR